MLFWTDEKRGLSMATISPILGRLKVAMGWVLLSATNWIISSNNTLIHHPAK